MLNDYERGILEARRINVADVESADLSPDSMLIKMKDGTEHRLCEIWTRVMGYCRPVHEFNKGKKSEFYTRTSFKENKAVAVLSDSCCCGMAAE